MIRKAWREWPVTLRVAIATGALMVLLGLIASQQVLSTLSSLQNERLREVAQSHVGGLKVALGSFVLHRDVWEVYDALDRAGSEGAGARILFSAVADDRGRVLASSDPTRAPIDLEFEALLNDAVPVQEVTASEGRNSVRIVEPLFVQGREVGSLLTELDVSDLLAQRRSTSLALLAANSVATLLLALTGYWVVARLLGPVELLTGQMGASGVAPQQIPAEDIARTDSAFAPLLHNFNSMIDAIDAQREAERRLAERERFVSLGRLSSSLAHEINNPLGGLLNATDTIRTYSDRPDVVRSSADILDRGLKHLRDVSRAILEENRRDRSNALLSFEDFDDLKILFEPEANRHGQQLDWIVDSELSTACALPSAPIRQIALNLLLNASSAAGKGGRVGLMAYAKSSGLDLKVTDNGPGLSKHARQRLLSETPLEPGGGVGLRLVRELVGELGGEIALERIGDLTSIQVHLPNQAPDQ